MVSEAYVVFFSLNSGLLLCFHLVRFIRDKHMSSLFLYKVEAIPTKRNKTDPPKEHSPAPTAQPTNPSPRRDKKHLHNNRPRLPLPPLLLPAPHIPRLVPCIRHSLRRRYSAHRLLLHLRALSRLLGAHRHARLVACSEGAGIRWVGFGVG